MDRILVINPNSSETCTAGISAAVSIFPVPQGVDVKMATLRDGPPAIYSWRDWHRVVDPLCGFIERSPASVYIIACASDPGVEAARAVTSHPVLGVFRSAVASAVARTERFGVIAIADASRSRHLVALRTMGLETRLAGHMALNMSMEDLLLPHKARPEMIAAARRLADQGAEAIILGCTGMAHHRRLIEEAVGVPVIEPCQAAFVLALGIVTPSIAITPHGATLAPVQA